MRNYSYLSLYAVAWHEYHVIFKDTDNYNAPDDTDPQV